MYVENGFWWVGRMWGWTLPKRLTAAPVRIKPVPRSLLSIHPRIVDLQFLFLHLGICVRMCLHFFQIKVTLSLSPYLLFFDGQRYCEKYSVLVTI